MGETSQRLAYGPVVGASSGIIAGIGTGLGLGLVLALVLGLVLGLMALLLGALILSPIFGASPGLTNWVHSMVEKLGLVDFAQKVTGTAEDGVKGVFDRVLEGLDGMRQTMGVFGLVYDAARVVRDWVEWGFGKVKGLLGAGQVVEGRRNGTCKPNGVDSYAEMVRSKKE